jgi:hypothetical protein
MQQLGLELGAHESLNKNYMEDSVVFWVMILLGFVGGLADISFIHIP